MIKLLENNLDDLSKALDDLRDASDNRNKLNELETERALNYLNRRLSGTYYNGEHFEDETEISFRVSPKASNRIDLLSDNDPCEHIFCYGPTQNGDKKVYLVFDDDNEEIGRFNKLPLLAKFIVGILNDEDWFKGNKEGQLDSLVEEGVENMIKLESVNNESIKLFKSIMNLEPFYEVEEEFDEPDLEAITQIMKPKSDLCAISSDDEDGNFEDIFENGEYVSNVLINVLIDNVGKKIKEIDSEMYDYVCIYEFPFGKAYYYDDSGYSALLFDKSTRNNMAKYIKDNGDKIINLIKKEL